MQDPQAKRRNREAARRAAERRTGGRTDEPAAPFAAEAAASLVSAYALADLLRSVTDEVS
ncbi:MAG: hypothetical protein ABSD74_11860 [Rhizomicrobium sp.]|jgi:hypothetical protein